jgi:hypothetical protein
MNELVQPGHGILVRRLEKTEPAGLSRRYYFDPAGLAEAMTRARGMGEAERRQIGSAARAFFLENDRAFRERFIVVMKAL